MSKSKEILQKKAKSSEPLKDSIDAEIEPANISEPEEPKTVINEEGKEVLVFEDPLHSKENRSIVNYSIFRGKWEFENIDDLDEGDHEKCAVQFTPLKDGSSLIITFKSLKDRVEFMDSIYSDNEMKQIGGGMRLENLANSKILRTTGGLIGLGLAGYGLYRLIFGKKDNK
ncbi:MAG: hypothetical protein HXY50_11160 [Ignavibacteriaceae bacterium]|nr:hypothetical protein [Ignavibacteriaceae bacterium]